MSNKEKKICLRCGYSPTKGEKAGACYVYGDKMGKRHLYDEEIKEEKWEKEFDRKFGVHVEGQWTNENLPPIKFISSQIQQAYDKGYIDGQALQVEKSVIVQMESQIQQAKAETRKEIAEWAIKNASKFSIRTIELEELLSKLNK